MKIFDLVLLAKIITVTISIAAPAFARPSEIPIIKAAREGRTSQVQALLDKGVGIESKDENGNTPLIEAVTYGQVDTVALLLKRGANPNARTKSVAAGIKLCAYGGEEVECNWHNQPVLYFALVNLTRYSRTPLQERPSYEQIAKLLIQADAKCRSENDFPQCPSSNSDFPTSYSEQIADGIYINAINDMHDFIKIERSQYLGISLGENRQLNPSDFKYIGTGIIYYTPVNRYFCSDRASGWNLAKAERRSRKSSYCSADGWILK